MAIKTCTCKDEWMDQKYGKGKRVANATKDGGFRCTKCGTKIIGNNNEKKK